MTSGWNKSQRQKEGKICPIDNKPCAEEVDVGFYTDYYRCRNYTIGMGYWWLVSSRPCYEIEQSSEAQK